MFFKWKERYYKAIERLDDSRNYNRNLIILNNKLSTTINNLNNLLGEDYMEVDLYCLNDSIYYIAEKRIDLTDFKYEIFYYTYNLSSINFAHISELEASINIKDKEKVNIRLDNINTICEQGSGHGSRQIQKLIGYGKDIRATKISGKLYNNTPIGLENLKRFYLKNGFEIKEDSFIMDLK